MTITHVVVAGMVMLASAAHRNWLPSCVLKAPESRSERMREMKELIWRLYHPTPGENTTRRPVLQSASDTWWKAGRGYHRLSLAS
jgi:hypothetical protein